MPRLLLALLLPIVPTAAPASDASPGARSGAQIVGQTCALCHGTGQGGAPRIGNVTEWRKRARFGLDGLVRSASTGKGAMPARGGMPDLSDAELRAAIAYMSGLESATAGAER